MPARLIRFFLIPILTLLITGMSYAGDTGIAGMITYRGQPVAGVYVEVFDRPPDVSQSPVSSTNTGSDGRFAFELPRGTYHLVARKKPSGGSSAGMLLGTSDGSPIIVRDGLIEIDKIELRDRGRNGLPVQGGIPVTGRTVYRGSPVAGAYIYVYPGDLRRGPGYISRVRTDEKGIFKVDLPPARYTITARLTDTGEGMGSVVREDLVGEYGGHPLTVAAGPMRLGTLELRTVSTDTWEKLRWAASEGGLSITGRVFLENGEPASGMFAFLYEDHRMVGKPDAISAPTGRDGYFYLAVPRSGSYYLGARSRYGGPVEPGELMGAYDESGIRSIKVEDNAQSASYDIIVREVW